MLWRGGCGPPAEVARGMSWSLSRPVAAHYALLQGRGYDLFQGRGDPRPPVLLRRRAVREVVMPVSGACAGEAPGVAALERLARASGFKEALRVGRRWDHGDLRREEAWQGWAG